MPCKYSKCYVKSNNFVLCMQRQRSNIVLNISGIKDYWKISDPDIPTRKVETHIQKPFITALS